MSSTIRVTDETHLLATRLSEQTGRQMQQIVADALAAYQRELFWADLDSAYDRLATDSEAWAAHRQEHEAQSPALRDGLE